MPVVLCSSLFQRYSVSGGVCSSRVARGVLTIIHTHIHTRAHVRARGFLDHNF